MMNHSRPLRLLMACKLTPSDNHSNCILSRIIEAVFILIVVIACKSASGSTIQASVVLDLDTGYLGTTSANQITYAVSLSPSVPIDMQNGDTLLVDFSFANGKGLTIENNVIYNGNQLAERLGIDVHLTVPGVTIFTTQSLTNLVFDGDLSSGPFTTSTGGVGFVSGRVIADMTSTMVTIYSGTYSLTIDSGVDVPTSGSISGLSGFGGGFSVFDSNVSTEVPAPAAFWLLSSGLLGLICVARRKITIDYN